MKLDRYSKIVLTIIALNLSWMTLKDAVVPAFAQSGPVHVILDQVNAYAFSFATVPVKVVN